MKRQAARSTLSYPPSPDETLIAIHTHLVLVAHRDVKRASDRVRKAYEKAERVGIPERVLRRAVQMIAPGQKRLNEKAAELVARAEAGAADAGLKAGALSPLDPRRNVAPQYSEGAT